MVNFADKSIKAATEIVPVNRQLDVKGPSFDRFGGTPLGEALLSRDEVSSIGFKNERGSTFATRGMEIEKVKALVAGRAGELGLSKVTGLN